jgi:pimeloyl-ACP methyl ester carboxylesterase
MPATERPLVLGADANLVGIVTAPGLPSDGTPGLSATGASPPATPTVPASPVVIFLNAGVIHRVGPHRLHVKLARQLADRGITSLRLDLSGIGDSRSVPGSLSFRQSSVADTRAAMDHLSAELGATRFAIVGLCSGADNALATAEVDPRVTHLVVLDPPAYVTPRAQARRMARRVRSLGGARATLAWGANAVARRVRQKVAALRGDDGDDAADENDEKYTGGRETPPPDVFRTQLTKLVERRVRILAIYSGALGTRYNHADQLFELFPEMRGRVDRAYFPAANHMFTELDEQRALMRTVIDWLTV